jgi:DNA-binding beta-propeller fold protein YncE
MKKKVRMRIIILLAAAAVLAPGVSEISRADGTTAAKDRKGGAHGLYSPMRLDFGPDGNLLVSDYRLGMIVTLSRKTNEPIRWFALKGRPLGIAYLKGHIYVGNAVAGRIDVFSAAGIQFKKSSSFKTAVENPTDIAVDPGADLIFAADGSAKHVKVFDTKGQLVGVVPASDPGHTLLAAPTGVAVDPARQEVLVSDYGNKGADIPARVQIFDYQGNYLDTIAGVEAGGGMGMGGWNTKPRFSRPQGLAVDSAGHVFVVDCFSCEVLVFDRLSGKLLKTLGGFGSEPGQMRLPLDIVIQSNTKDLFVTNNRDARVEVFREGGVL